MLTKGRTGELACVSAPGDREHIRSVLQPIVQKSAFWVSVFITGHEGGEISAAKRLLWCENIQLFASLLVKENPKPAPNDSKSPPVTSSMCELKHHTTLRP